MEILILAALGLLVLSPKGAQNAPAPAPRAIDKGGLMVPNFVHDASLAGTWRAPGEVAIRADVNPADTRVPTTPPGSGGAGGGSGAQYTIPDLSGFNFGPFGI